MYFSQMKRQTNSVIVSFIHWHITYWRRMISVTFFSPSSLCYLLWFRHCFVWMLFYCLFRVWYFFPFPQWFPWFYFHWHIQCTLFYISVTLCHRNLSTIFFLSHKFQYQHLLLPKTIPLFRIRNKYKSIYFFLT